MDTLQTDVVLKIGMLAHSISSSSTAWKGELFSVVLPKNVSKEHSPEVGYSPDSTEVSVQMEVPRLKELEGINLSDSLNEK